MYNTRFVIGATIFPRVLFMVETQSSGPLGLAAGRQAGRLSTSHAVITRRRHGRSSTRSKELSKPSSYDPSCSARASYLSARFPQGTEYFHWKELDFSTESIRDWISIPALRIGGVERNSSGFIIGAATVSRYMSDWTSGEDLLTSYRYHHCVSYTAGLECM